MGMLYPHMTKAALAREEDSARRALSQFSGWALSRVGVKIQVTPIGPASSTFLFHVTLDGKEVSGDDMAVVDRFFYEAQVNGQKGKATTTEAVQ